MLHNAETVEEVMDRRELARRGHDEVRYWLPLVLSLASTLIALGVVYGALGGRLQLIEYRLLQIEQHMGERR